MRFLLLLVARAAVAGTIAPADVPLNLIEIEQHFLVSTNSGYGKHFLQSYDESRHVVSGRLELPSLWYGLAYEPATETLLAADGSESIYAVRMEKGHFGAYREIRLPGCKLTAGIAVQTGSRVVIACNQTGEVMRVNFETGAMLGRRAVGAFPYAVRSLPDNRLAVSNWGDSSVSILDGENLSELTRLHVGSHPSDMLVLNGAGLLAIACSDSDSVALIDLAHLRTQRQIDLRIPGNRLSGAQPDALAYEAASHRLYVGLAAVDAIAIFRLTDDDLHFNGLIPASPDPTALVFSENSRALYYASGRDPKPGPNVLPNKQFRYIGNLVGGSIVALTADDLARLGAMPLTFAQQIYGTKPAREDSAQVRKFSGPNGPIQHVFYVIKENRTYDQVLGDIKEGNGAPDLVLFGENVTPNHHALAREFLLFDNFYVDGYVSADGHLWSTAAISTDYVNKLWPSNYSKRANGVFDAPYDGDEQHDRPMATPASGFIWDRARKAGVTYRNYGEWNITNPADPKHNLNYLAGLKDHFDPTYLDEIGETTDQSRIDEFQREFREFERSGKLPQLIIMHLPNDHTMGTKPGYPTPTAMVADNDLALGRLVELISKSKYWRNSAIFVLEDDAQSGPDHVDARRSVMLAISPYTRRHSVTHASYSTVSVLRTINQLLGLGSLTYFDDRAVGLLREFRETPATDLYIARKPQSSLSEKNRLDAPGAQESTTWDLSRPDRAPEAALNLVIWQSVKGAQSSPPTILAVRKLPEMCLNDSNR